MFDLEESLLALLAFAVIAGIWSVWRVRGTRDPQRAIWGRRIFLIAFGVIGGGTLVAANCAARCLIPFAVVACSLAIAMLWENPFRVWQEG